MKEYPHIEYWNRGVWGDEVYAFNKYDGSNIRVEWDRRTAKKSNFTGGFRKFGTRMQLIKKTSQFLGDSVDLFMDKYSDGLNELLFKDSRLRNIDQVTFFAEYYGKKSFAGYHIKDDPKDIILFDAFLYKKGWIIPETFIDLFYDLGIPEVIYKGEYNREFITSIKNNTTLHEGVVAKGTMVRKGQRTVWMTKVKTNVWLKRLFEMKGKTYLLREVGNDDEIIESLDK